MKVIFYLSLLNIIAAETCEPGSPGCCDTMMPPSFIPPNDSSCWNWWDPPEDGVIPTDMPIPPKGCDYSACEAAVCACDSYCCEAAWDLSCRGYTLNSGDAVENNFFVDNCSARILCCEPETAYPKPQPVLPPAEAVPEVLPDTSNQCEPGSPNCCATLSPPSFIAPDDSTCWQWWDPPADGIMKPDTPTPQKGCDYQPCQDSVCACDSYCCETAWDLSCRGYTMSAGDAVENNYFVDQCSARVLCCETESSFPKPPQAVNPGPEVPPEIDTSNQCTPGVDKDCCETMVPPSFLAPDDSTCWQWWTPPVDGIPEADMPEPPKGCDYKPCQDAVCACDQYCCNVAWDLSCRGYNVQSGDAVENNYFVDGCSAKMLCCEQDSAFPDPPQAILTSAPTESPTPVPTSAPTESPTPVPTSAPTPSPTPVPPTGSSTSITVIVPITDKPPEPVLPGGITNIDVTSNIISEETTTTTVEQIVIKESTEIASNSKKSKKNKGKSGAKDSKGKSGGKASKGKSGGKASKGKSGGKESKGKSGEKVRS